MGVLSPCSQRTTTAPWPGQLMPPALKIRAISAAATKRSPDKLPNKPIPENPTATDLDDPAAVAFYVEMGNSVIMQGYSFQKNMEK